MAMERHAESAAANLSASILARYHEEQIWSDKIRRMSTWGTWGLMGVNVLLFLVFQIGVEPWRRKRLVKGFEDKVMEALEREGPGAAAIPSSSSLPTPTSVIEPPAPSVPPLDPDPAPALPPQIASSNNPPSLTLSPPFPSSSLLASIPTFTAAFKSIVRDLFSDRPITIRRLDLTAAALEGAAAGIVAVAMVLLVYIRQK